MARSGICYAMIAAAVAFFPAGPSEAYFDGSLGDRVRYCATQAYALVEALQSLWESVGTTDAAVVGVPPAEAARTFDLVHRVANAGVARISADLRACLAWVEPDVRPDPVAKASAAILETELGFATKQLGKLRDTLDDMEVTLRRKWGEAGAQAASSALQGFRTAAAVSRADVAAFTTRANDLSLRTGAP